MHNLFKQNTEMLIIVNVVASYTTKLLLLLWLLLFRIEVKKKNSSFLRNFVVCLKGIFDYIQYTIIIFSLSV